MHLMPNLIGMDAIIRCFRLSLVANSLDVRRAISALLCTKQ